MSDTALFHYILHLGDNCLILGHRVSEWCGHAPILEEDIALANQALDLIGQAQLWLSLAGKIEGQGRSADDLAYLRDERGFRNFLMVEQPNGDFAATLMRQFLFDHWHLATLTALSRGGHAEMAEIAEKAAKEATYHLDRSRDLVIRLGDGSDESHRRMQSALDNLWHFSGEMSQADDFEQALINQGLAPDSATIAAQWQAQVDDALAQATLTKPEQVWMRKGGKQGIHSEHMGYLLAEMQYMQRAYPGATW